MPPLSHKGKMQLNLCREIESSANDDPTAHTDNSQMPLRHGVRHPGAHRQMVRPMPGTTETIPYDRSSRREAGRACARRHDDKGTVSSGGSGPVGPPDVVAERLS